MRDHVMLDALAPRLPLHSCCARGKSADSMTEVMMPLELKTFKAHINLIKSGLLFNSWCSAHDFFAHFIPQYAESSVNYT